MRSHRCARAEHDEESTAVADMFLQGRELFFLQPCNIGKDDDCGARVARGEIGGREVGDAHALHAYDRRPLRVRRLLEGTLEEKRAALGQRWIAAVHQKHRQRIVKLKNEILPIVARQTIPEPIIRRPSLGRQIRIEEMQP